MIKLNKSGFTLIEFLSVIVIIAIVAAVTMTVIVPMIKAGTLRKAETRAQEFNEQVAKACEDSSLDIEIKYYTDKTKSEETTFDACSQSECYFELSGDMSEKFSKEINASQDIPANIKMLVASCEVKTACLDYTSGNFEGLKVETKDGVVTSETGNC